jgi:hypothetical protein
MDRMISIWYYSSRRKRDEDMLATARVLQAKLALSSDKAPD